MKFPVIIKHLISVYIKFAFPHITVCTKVNKKLITRSTMIENVYNMCIFKTLFVVVWSIYSVSFNWEQIF
jgi:bacteriorhodopsin